MSKRKTNRLAVPLMLLMVAAAGTVALALYVKMTPADRVRPVEPEPTVNRPVDPAPLSTRQKVLIPIASRSGDELRFTQADYEVPEGQDKKTAAVNEFLARSSILPSDVKLEEIVMDGDTAELQFPESLTSGQGSFDEATLIQGLRAVLGQFPEVKRYRLFAGGHEVKELGHFELGDPIAVLPLANWGDPNGHDPASGESGSTTAPPPSMPR